MVALRSSPRLSDEERRRVLHDWNATAADFPDACTHELFERQVERTPDAVAVVSGGSTITYRELDQRANQVGHFLRGRGVGPEVLVGVCLERSVELVIALLGVWKAGGAYVPLDPTYPAERLEFMAGDAGMRVLLTEHGCARLFRPGTEAVCLDADWSRIASQPVTNPGAPAKPSSLAYVMYTSGSTGRPKGAEILHSGLVNYLWWAIRAYGIEAGGSVPVHTSVSFDLTVTSLYPALLSGGCVELLAEAGGARSLVAALRTGSGRNLVKITPAHLDVLSQELAPTEVAGMTRAFVIGGESLAAEALRLWRENAPGTRLFNEYGPTETVVGCCVHEVRPEDPPGGPVPIGKPIANTELYVLDADLQPVAPGVTGELYVGGAGVARGYLHRPELTRERFLPDPFSGRVGGRIYKTGDLARHRDDGTLEYLGRVDTQIKLRGYRIELGEIEAALAGHPGVQACAVIVREDVPGDKQLVGYAVARAGETPTTSVLQGFLKERLPDYMVPSRIALLPELPLTRNGKVDRKALPVPSEVPAVSPSDGVTPRNEVEEVLAAIWAELLRVQRVSVHDDFFDLGGHSLLALKVLARVREALNVELPPGSLFETPTVAGLAALAARLLQTEERVQRIPPRDRDVPGPLSHAQEQLWLLEQLAPGSPAYNVIDVATLRAAYSAQALKLALEQLVLRHEVLATAFVPRESGVEQVVHDGVTLDVPEIDLSGLADTDREREWYRIVRAEGRKLFDLTRAPLIRAVVVHLAPEEHRVLLVIHHIVADEWSLEVLQTELRDLYAAFAAGRPSPLAPTSVQYGDFASWQRGCLRAETLDAQREYWRRELSGATTVLHLATDRSRPSVPTLGGATELFTISGRTANRLHALGRQSRATLFMVLETAFAALLHRSTGQDDVLVGTPISGRKHADTERIVGYFLDTIVLRSQLADDTSFRALLERTRVRALGAYANADLPFDHVVRMTASERDPGRSPLFQAMFVLHDRNELSRISRLSEHQRLQNGTSKFDLTLYMSETEDGLEGLLEYGTDLFDAGTARALCRAMATLLDGIADDPDQLVSRLPLLAPPDARRQLLEWNDTGRSHHEGDLYVHELFERQARKTPRAVAVVSGAESLQYAELDRRADEVARRLTALGVGPDVLVGLLVERSLDMVVGLLGILKAGGAYVPLDPAFPPGRLAHMVEDSGMGVLVTHREMHRTLSARPAAILQLDGAGEAVTSGPAPPHAERDTGRLAYVLYTSGSTGRPKGVAIPHAAMVNFLRSMQVEPGMTGTDVLLSVTTLSFDIAGLELLLPLSTGASVVVAGREDAMDPQRLMVLMEESHCTLMQATPATWRALIAAGWTGGPKLRVLCGGEAMPPDLLAGLLGRCGELWNMYGPTETTVWSTLEKLTVPDATPLIGRPIANTRAYVLDRHRQLLPEGAVGELYIGGMGLARGYLNRPELTRDRFVDSPFDPGARLYRTGDLARWRDGRLECLGRTDHQIKVRGYRIEPGEVEAVLASHPSVRQAVVVAREDEPGDRRLVAYVVAQGSEAVQEELRAHAGASLPGYMVPSHIVALDALPLTPNGKVDRRALPAPSARAAADRESMAPRDEMETLVARIWEDVLGSPVTSVRQSFFDLGGYSLLAVRVFARIRDATGISLPVATLLTAPTVENLASHLREQRATRDGVGTPRHAPPSTSLVCFRQGGARPPLFCVHGAGGNVLNLHELARHLSTDRPFYAFQARGVDGQQRPHGSIEEMAEAYLAELHAVQPRGPYLLAGYCGGSLVAYEVALRLRARGERVAFLGLIDLYRPGLPLASTRLENVARALRAHGPVRIAGMARRRLEASARESVADLRVRYHLARGSVMPYELRDRWLMGSFLQAAQRYELRQYAGTLTVFRARDGNRGDSGAPILRDPGPELGWGPLAKLGVETHEVPGDHHSLVVPPNVGVLATQLEACLRRAERTRSSS